jgi:surface carbohydrate biosynthesis protein (TIGR04326 family)
LIDSKSSIYIKFLKLDPDSPEPVEQLYHWSNHEETDSVHSLSSYVEKHSNRLREKYLAWVHDLGESQIVGKRLIDHLALEEGLSYWWMTLFVEKSVYKSPISDAIYLIAIEEIISEQKPAKIRLVSSSRPLNEALTGLCMSLDIAYEWEKLPNKPRQQLNLRAIFHALPYPAQALIGLFRHIWRRWPLRKVERTGWFQSEKSLFLCSYFFNINTDLAKKGTFHSHYWGGLHDLMREMGIPGNWLQHYFRHTAVPSPQKALNFVQRFNQKRLEHGFHTFLDTYLSWRVVLRVLNRWFRLVLICRELSEVKHAFNLHGSNFSLWPLMQQDWYNSMCGCAAINNLLWIELFDIAVSELPHQKMGFYLCENQSWERALVHTWRKHGHGELIAVPHSTMRFWDLRFSADPRTIKSSNSYPMPQADLTALNGKISIDHYLNAGYPKKDIVECEALRYSYLDKLRAGSREENTREEIKVLILGDFMPSCTIKMLQLLEAALPHMTVAATYTIKPHPNYQVNPDDYPSLNLKVAMDHLEKILYDFDVAYSANKTSASMDSYIAGLQTVVMLDNAELNFSPLREQPSVSFVKGPEELAEALQIAQKSTIEKPDNSNFFFLDPELRRWKKLLSSL